MDIAKLTAIVTILITLSIASERLVEIIKGFIPYLNPDTSEGPPEADTVFPEPYKEAKRKAIISIVAVCCGIATAFLASPILAGIFKDLFSGSTCKLTVGFANLGENSPCGFDLSGNGLFLVLALGLLASGGSTLWNSILEYLLKIKDLKKSEVKRAESLRRIEVEAARVRLEGERARLLKAE